MKSNIITIAKKELVRFFSNKASACIAILLPGILIYGMYSFMGSAIAGMFSGDENKPITIEAVNMPASIKPLAEAAGFTVVGTENVSTPEEIRAHIKEGDIGAFAVFPYGFDEEVASYDPASGIQAPQVAVYYNATDSSSRNTLSTFTALLDSYESSLSNRFDVNAGEGTYDVSEERDRTSSFIVSIVPMLLLILLFSGCMSVAAEAIAGEKERGTMATLLATPVKRGDIALGKIAALALIGLLIALSSAIGIFASLPKLMGGDFSLDVYGAPEYLLLILVILSTTLVIVMLITIVSALAKTTKEAQVYLTPLMIVVMLVGLTGMFGNGAQTDVLYYFIPLYNSVQCMIGILSFDFQPLNMVVCVVSNVIYTGIGVAVLQRMFNSERLMFAR